jgi:hypothetical protein
MHQASVKVSRKFLEPLVREKSWSCVRRWMCAVLVGNGVAGSEQSSDNVTINTGYERPVVLSVTAGLWNTNGGDLWTIQGKFAPRDTGF